MVRQARIIILTLADTEAACAFAAMLPLTLDMRDLDGNEKKELISALPTNASRPGTIGTKDLLSWGSRTVVVFVQTFDAPYFCTRLGRLDDPIGLPRCSAAATCGSCFQELASDER